MLQQLLSNFVEFRHDQQFGLNFIKVLSMLLVTISHYGIIIGSNDRQSMINSNMMIFMINSLYAVDLFFLVSGIMLGKKILSNQSYFMNFKEGSYILLDRILRVYPVYWLVLSFYIILPVILQNIGYQQNCEEIIFDMIFLVQNITNKFGCFEWSWYIAVEIQMLVILLISFIMISKIVKLFICWKQNGKQQLIESDCIKLLSCITVSLLLLSLFWSVFTCINENYKISFYSMTDKTFYYNFYQKPQYKMTSFLIGILYGIGKKNSFYFMRFFIINNPYIRKILTIMFLYYSLYVWVYIKDNKEFIPDIIQNLYQSTSRFILCIGIIYSNILNINTQNYILNYIFQILSKLLYCIYLTHYFLFQIIINKQLFDLGNIFNYIISLLIVVLLSAIVYQKIEKQLSEKIITKLRQKFLQVNNQRTYQKIK